MRRSLIGVALFVFALASAEANAHGRDHVGEVLIPSWYVVTNEGKLYQFYSKSACEKAARYLTLQQLKPSHCASVRTK